MANLERRFTPSPVQLRADGERRIGGYAAVFNKLSRNLGGFVERVAPTFFAKTRASGWPDVCCRYNHDDNMLLGTTGGNTLRLWVDDAGLLYEADPPASRADILELVARGDVRKSSFAFRLDADGDQWTLTDQGYPLRSLTSGQLVDVAPVNSPAYPDSTAGLRSADPDTTAWLRRLGLGAETALRSLAAHVQADPDEVFTRAEADNLKSFLIRTDHPAAAKPKLFGPAAAAALLARREDPWV